MAAPNFCCIVESENKYGLLAAPPKQGGNWTISGFKSIQQGLDYWETQYKRAHQRSYEASMSACIFFIFFRPSIVKLTLTEIAALIEDKVIQNWWMVAGGVDVIPLKQTAKTVWKAGQKPTLIKEEWLK